MPAEAGLTEGDGEFAGDHAPTLGAICGRGSEGMGEAPTQMQAERTDAGSERVFWTCIRAFDRHV
ncbi:hypothetical protein GCM10010458_12460 [Microbacterium luteolum]